MNESKNGTMKGYLITFGITLLATVIGAVIVEKMIRKTDPAAVAAKANVAQPPRQVTVVTEDKTTTV